MAPTTVITSNNITPAITSATTTTTTTTKTTTTSAGTTTTTTTTMQLDKWVKNLLGVPLMEAQVSLLAHGPNFALAPRYCPWGIHHHSRASMPEPGATQCRGTEG